MMRHLSLTILLTASLCASATAQAGAQGVPPVTPGMRLRVTLIAPPAQTRIATLQALNDSALVLSDAAPVALANISQLEWSSGRPPNLLTGALGLILGAAAGAAVACAANRDSYGVYCGGQSDTKVVIGTSLGGVSGGLLGALLFRRDRWRPVDLSRLRSGRL